MATTISGAATEDANSDSFSLTLPNGVNALAAEYSRYAKATAEGILNLAEILVRAEDELGLEGFPDFLKAVGLEGREATVSKHRTIGKAAERLRALGEFLPNSWTTLYLLAKLPPETFDAIKGDISAHMTAAELRGLLPRNPRLVIPKGVSPQPAVSVRTISIRFGGNGLLDEFLRALEELKQRFSFEVDVPATLITAAEADTSTVVPLRDAA